MAISLKLKSMDIFHGYPLGWLNAIIIYRRGERDAIGKEKRKLPQAKLVRRNRNVRDET